MNTDLKENQKGLWQGLFKLMNNAAFGKNMKNVRKHSDIKLVTTEASTKPN